MNHLLRIALCALLCAACPLVCPAQTTDKWTGKSSPANHNWSDPTNWSLGAIPNSSNDVVITSPASNPGAVLQDIPATVHNLTIDSFAELSMGDVSLTVVGTSIRNSGSLVLNNDGFATTSLIINGNVILGGGGTISMYNNSVISGGGTLTSYEVIDSVLGVSGSIGQGGLTLNNRSIINASGPGVTLTIAPSGTVSNRGILEATGNNSTLVLAAAATQNEGVILGGPGNVMLNGGTVIGGTLEGGTGIIGPLLGGSVPTLDGVAILDTYQINSNTATHLEGTITNNGIISVNDLDPVNTSSAHLIISGQATLAGTGVVSLNGPNNYINGIGTLINQQTIEGTGTIAVKYLTNNGSIGAFVSNLTIQPAGSLNNVGGTISANNDATVTLIGPATFSGGTISAGENSLVTVEGAATLAGVTTTGSGVVNVVLGTLDGSSTPVTNSTTIQVNNGDALTVKGTLNNQSTINLDGSCLSCPPAAIYVNRLVNLNGSGNLIMSYSNNYIEGLNGNDTLKNNSTIQGSGDIGNNLMNLVNGVKGTINATGGSPLLVFPGPTNTVNNLGTLSAGPPDYTLEITGNLSNYNSTTKTLTAGTFIANGTVQLPGDVVTNAAKLTLGAPGAQFVDQSDFNALLGLNNNATISGFFGLSGGANFTTQGDFTNSASVKIQKASTFTLGGSSTNYSQTAGTTTVDGTLAVPIGGLIDVTGGTLQSAGTFSGSVSLGNASGAAATFIIGDSLKKAALVSISDNYTQHPTGILDVQIGGTKAGTNYSHLSVTGPVTVGGTVNISLINKFTPVIGQTFTVLNAPSGITGTFSTANGLSINSGEHFNLTSNPTTLVLEVVSGP